MTEVDWSNLDGEFASVASAVTVGVFDGLHSGHRALVSRVTGSGLKSVVVTFQRHPTEILLHDDIPGYIMSLGQKRRVLIDLGVDISVLINFNESFRRTPGDEFLARLAANFCLRRLVVGHDFRCGYRLDTGIDRIRAYFDGADVEVVAVDPVAEAGAPVSSTRIRDSILAGEIARANTLLGREFSLDVSDEEISTDADRAFIVKTEGGLLPQSRQLVPRPGEYRVELISGASEADPAAVRREATLEIGENSLGWPLAASESIRYIVVKDRR